MGSVKGTRPPEKDGYSKLFWVSFAANAVYMALLFWAFLTAPEALDTGKWPTFVAILAYGLAAFAVSLTKEDLGTAKEKVKAVAKRVYAFITKELSPRPPAPSAEQILSVAEEFITALCNSPASKLPFFQRLYYETEPIEGSDVCYLHPVTRWSTGIYSGVLMYNLSLLRLSAERLSDDMLFETLRVLRRLIQRHLEDGSLSLGEFPITYDGVHPSLYLFTVDQDSDYVHLGFMWATPENVAAIIEQYDRSHPAPGNDNDQDF